MVNWLARPVVTMCSEFKPPMPAIALTGDGILFTPNGTPLGGYAGYGAALI
jgi:hypothetical protein